MFHIVWFRSRQDGRSLIAPPEVGYSFYRRPGSSQTTFRSDSGRA
jgi:hypothetical protein